MKRFLASSDEKLNSGASLNTLDMRFFNMHSQETLNNDIDMNNNKITNLKDGSSDNDAVNKKQLDEKVDTIIFANLSTDVRWLQDRHVLPDTFNTQIGQLLTRINSYDTLSSKVSAIEAKLNKLKEIKTLKVDSRSGYITDKITNEHLLFEVSTFTIIIPGLFTFQTSNGLEWHDLSHHAIRGVLGYNYIRIVDKIQENKKQVVLFTYNNDWIRKPIFTNYYSLRYTFEYITTESIVL
jgi:hypothetical protein